MVILIVLILYVMLPFSQSLQYPSFILFVFGVLVRHGRYPFWSCILFSKPLVSICISVSFSRFGEFFYDFIQNVFSALDLEFSFCSACNLSICHFLSCSVCVKDAICFEWMMQFLFLVFKSNVLSSTRPCCW